MSGTTHLITAPTEDVVSFEEAKKYLRQTTNDNDDLIRALRDSATAQLDPASGGWLGRALRPQTWEWRSRGFPSYPYSTWTYQPGAIRLPYPTLITVDSVKHLDEDGVEQTLVSDVDYRVIGSSNGFSYVVPSFEGTWPSSVRTDYESVKVRYTAGYAGVIPAPIKQAVLLAIRDLWSLSERNLYLRAESAPGLASYEWTVSEMAGKVIRSAVENLLQPYRVYE